MTEQLNTAASDLMKGVDKAAKGLTENAAKMSETAVSYRDALAHAGPPNSRGMAAPTQPSFLVPRVQAREGVRAR